MTTEGKNQDHIPKTSNNNNKEIPPIADPGLDQSVSEGSTVVLNGHGVTNDQNRKITSYSSMPVYARPGRRHINKKRESLVN